jgi:hypothetical protein
VGVAEGVETRRADLAHTGEDLFRRKRVARAELVFVFAGAVDEDRRAVQPKRRALRRGGIGPAEGADAETRFHLIQHAPAFEDRRLQRVERRRRQRPHRYLGQHQRARGRVLADGDPTFRAQHRDLPPGRVEHARIDHKVAARAVVRDRGGETDRGPRLGRVGVVPHVDAIGFHPHLLGGDQRDRPENAHGLAALGESGRLRATAANPGQVGDAGRMIGAHGEQVRSAERDEVGDIQGEGGASAGMLTRRTAVDPDGRVGTHALEKKIHAPTAFGRIHRELAPIPRGAVAVAMDEATQAGVVVPVVRHVHPRPRGDVQAGLREVVGFTRIVIPRDGEPAAVETGFAAGTLRGGRRREASRRPKDEAQKPAHPQGRSSRRMTSEPLTGPVTFRGWPWGPSASGRDCLVPIAGIT